MTDWDHMCESQQMPQMASKPREARREAWTRPAEVVNPVTVDF